MLLTLVHKTYQLKNSAIQVKMEEEGIGARHRGEVGEGLEGKNGEETVIVM